MEEIKSITEKLFNLVNMCRVIYGYRNTVEFISGMFIVVYQIKKKKEENADFDDMFLLKQTEIINALRKEKLMLENIELNKETIKLFNSLDDTYEASIRDIMNELLNSKIKAEDFIKIYDCFVDKIIDKDFGMNSSADLVCRIIAALVGKVGNSVIYDGCAGIGKILTEIIKNNSGVRIVAQDRSDFICTILKTRLTLTCNNFCVHNASALTNDKLVNKNSYDYATIDWPYGMTINKEEMKQVELDKRVYVHGIPSQASSVFLIMQQVLFSLKKDGKAFFVVPDGILFKSGKDAKVRKSIINMDVIESVIALPDKVHKYTNIPLNILVINMNKQKKSEIQFINAKSLLSINNLDNDVLDNKIEYIVNTYNSKEEIKHFSKNIKLCDIHEENLLPSFYINDKTVTVKTSYFNEVEINESEVEKISQNEYAVKLSDIAELYKGLNIQKSENDLHGKYNVLNMSGLKDGKIDYDDVIKSNLEKFRDIPLLKKGDILLSCKGEAIKMAIFEKDDGNYTATQSVIIIRCEKNCYVKYLKYYLDSPAGRHLLTKIQKGAFIPMISIKDLGSIDIILPKLEAQHNIVESFEGKLRKLEEEKAQIDEKIQKTRESLYDEMEIKEMYIRKGQANDESSK